MLLKVCKQKLKKSMKVLSDVYCVFTKKYVFFLRLHSGPKKRVVQPRLIGPAAKSVKKEKDEPSSQSTDAITAAVAASAAIAATQPFLKVRKLTVSFIP